MCIVCVYIYPFPPESPELPTSHPSRNPQQAVFLVLFSNFPLLYVRRVYTPWFFVSSQQRFGVMDIKAP